MKEIFFEMTKNRTEIITIKKSLGRNFVKEDYICVLKLLLFDITNNQHLKTITQKQIRIGGTCSRIQPKQSEKCGQFKSKTILDNAY